MLKFKCESRQQHERLGEAMPKYVTDLTSMPNMETRFIPMLQAVLLSPKL